MSMWLQITGACRRNCIDVFRYDLEHDSRLRLALKNVAPISALPGVVIEHQQRGVDLYVRLPSVFVGIARADPSHQRYPADVSQRRSPAFPESAAAAVGRVTLILCGAVDPGPPVRR